MHLPHGISAPAEARLSLNSLHTKAQNTKNKFASRRWKRTLPNSLQDMQKSHITLAATAMAGGSPASGWRVRLDAASHTASL